MIGQHLEGPPGSLWPALVPLVLGAAVAVAAVAVGHPPLAVLAAPFLTVALVLWGTRQPRFSADVAADGLHLHEPPLHLPYADLLSVSPIDDSSRPAFGLCLIHRGGRLLVPARLNVPSSDLFAFLLQQLPADAGLPLPASLDDYRRKQEAAFGPDRVFAFRKRPPGPGSARSRRRGLVGFALGAAGLVWIVAGAVLGEPYTRFIGLGIAFALLGFLFGLVLFMGPDRAAHLRLTTGLVIGPAGLALVQGDLKGELRWDEVRRILYPYRSRFAADATSRGRSGIGLVLDGAIIVLGDVYDQPLQTIRDLLEKYWDG